MKVKDGQIWMHKGVRYEVFDTQILSTSLRRVYDGQTIIMSVESVEMFFTLYEDVKKKPMFKRGDFIVEPKAGSAVVLEDCYVNSGNVKCITKHGYSDCIIIPNDRLMTKQERFDFLDTLSNNGFWLNKDLTLEPFKQDLFKKGDFVTTDQSDTVGVCLNDVFKVGDEGRYIFLDDGSIAVGYIGNRLRLATESEICNALDDLNDRGYWFNYDKLKITKRKAYATIATNLDISRPVYSKDSNITITCANGEVHKYVLRK